MRPRTGMQNPHVDIRRRCPHPILRSRPAHERARRSVLQIWIAAAGKGGLATTAQVAIASGAAAKRRNPGGPKHEQ
jgi:hypothetical protein